MKVHRPSEIPAQPVNAPLFTGGPVTRQTLITPEASKDFNLGIVTSARARVTRCTRTAVIKCCS
jgi:hypothetical protein